MEEISLDEDLEDIDFRVKEVIEDLIKRINTRITLVENNKLLIEELTTSYNIDESKIAEDIEISKLNKSDFDDLLK